ncbi:hypothetical protein LFZ73_001338 [Salmonella enterica]|nr:hypothetical protein [Salmonella enterica]
MLDFRWVVKNRKIQPEAAFFPTKNQGLEWMNSNPRMQIAITFCLFLLKIHAEDSQRAKKLTQEMICAHVSQRTTGALNV